MYMHIKCWVQFYGIHALLMSVYGSQLDSESLSHDGIPKFSTCMMACGIWKYIHLPDTH